MKRLLTLALVGATILSMNTTSYAYSYYIDYTDPDFQKGMCIDEESKAQGLYSDAGYVSSESWEAYYNDEEYIPSTPDTTRKDGGLATGYGIANGVKKKSSTSSKSATTYSGDELNTGSTNSSQSTNSIDEYTISDYYRRSSSNTGNTRSQSYLSHIDEVHFTDD